MSCSKHDRTRCYTCLGIHTLPGQPADIDGLLQYTPPSDPPPPHLFQPRIRYYAWLDAYPTMDEKVDRYIEAFNSYGTPLEMDRAEVAAWLKGWLQRE